MREPGDRRPSSGAVDDRSGAGDRGRARTFSGGGSRSPALSVALAVGVALLAALGWAILRGILDLGIGLLALAGIGGWAIGMLLRPIPRAPLAAVGLAVLAWLGGMVLTWLIALAIRPGSSLTLPERLAGTPFLDWLAPQFGLFQVAGLVLYVIGAAYGARAGGASS